MIDHSSAKLAPRIAIVDDDEDVRVALGELLQSFGYMSTLFESADNFLASSPPDDANCVISDVHMPGTDGLKLAKLIQPRGTPVILITAYPSCDLDAKASEAGVHSIFRKPFDPAQLVDRLELILRSSH